MDHSQIICPIISAFGIGTHSIYFSHSTGKAIKVVDSDPDKNARFMTVVMSSGTFSAGSIINLMEIGNTTQAIKDSGELLGGHRLTTG